VIKITLGVGRGGSLVINSNLFKIPLFKAISKVTSSLHNILDNIKKYKLLYNFLYNNNPFPKLK